MFFTIIKKEIVSNVLSARFAVTFVLFFGLILVSMFILTNDYKMALQRYDASVAAHKEELSEIKAIEDPQQRMNELLYSRGTYSDRRPKELSIFAKGLEDNTPTQVHTSAWMSRQVNEELYRNPIFSLFATPDFSYIVNIVLSLLALLFVFDAVCGEKESGTLKLMLSNSLPRDIIILSKWIGGYISLIGPFLIAVFGGLIYVRASGVIPLGGENLARIAFMIFISLLYISLFFTLGLLISTLTHKSSTALLISLFVWICWILVIPNLAPVIAKITTPVPTLQKINAEKEAVDREVEIRMRRISRSMLGYGEEANKMREELEQEGKRRKDRLDDFYNTKMKSQIDISKTISRVSPSASFKYASTGLAETGTSLYDNFKRAYRRFRDEFQSYAERLQEKQRDEELDDDWFHLDEVPRLRIFDETVRDTVNKVLLDILLMVIYNALFFMGAYTFFLRYDVR